MDSIEKVIAEASDIATGMARVRLVIMVLMLGVQIAIFVLLLLRLPS